MADEEESLGSSILLEGMPIKPKSSPAHRVGSINADEKSMPKFSLQHEFSLLNTNIPHIDVEVLDSVKRHAMIRVSVNGHVIMLQIVFPESYPGQECPPEFIYCQGTSIDDNLAESLIDVLKVNAQNRLKKGKPCLEQCLRALVTTLKKVIFAFAFSSWNLISFVFIRLRAPVISLICDCNRHVWKAHWVAHYTMHACRFRKQAAHVSVKLVFWSRTFSHWIRKESVFGIRTRRQGSIVRWMNETKKWLKFFFFCF